MSETPSNRPQLAPVRVGVIGCGNISKHYFQYGKNFAILDLAACADLNVDAARQRASEFGIPRALTVEELLADSGIELILNLTIPDAHAKVNLAALRAEKHVYCEKPFALSVKEGQAVLAEARAHRLLTGCAPDTVLGGGIQTCRKLVDDGRIGRPIAAVANFLSRGVEHWHPNPNFYYQRGGGPLFDMGPYYLTSLVTMLGPARRVSAMNSVSFPQRKITSQPKFGEIIQVEVPTHLIGTIEFAQGALATVTMSFDVAEHHLPRLEIYGTEGSLSCPDPNTFAGAVGLSTRSSPAWQTVPLTHPTEVGRGIGLADMAYAIRTGRPHRANGDLALHVVEIMEAIHRSAESGAFVTLETTCAQPAPLPMNLPPGTLDL